MTEKNWIQNVLEDNGYVCRPYSGRGMYGKSCLGITMKRGEMTEFDLGVLLGTRQEEYGSLSLSTPRTDNMGLDMIAYWPYIQYVEYMGVDDEEEEEEDGTDT